MLIQPFRVASFPQSMRPNDSDLPQAAKSPDRGFSGLISVHREYDDGITVIKDGVPEL